MSCPRCQGIMVSVRLEDAMVSSGPELLGGWRCLTCGEVLDPVIASNRRAPVHPVKNRARLPGGVMMDRAAKGKARRP